MQYIVIIIIGNIAHIGPKASSLFLPIHLCLVLFFLQTLTLSLSKLPPCHPTMSSWSSHTPSSDIFSMSCLISTNAMAFQPFRDHCWPLFQMSEDISERSSRWYMKSSLQFPIWCFFLQELLIQIDSNSNSKSRQSIDPIGMTTEILLLGIKQVLLPTVWVQSTLP